MKIIITDITRFSNKDTVCIAGLCADTCECIRPLPYYKLDKCKELGFAPGVALDAKFKKPVDTEPPHIEDRFHDKLKILGPVSKKNFSDLLSRSEAPSIEDGFQVKIASGEHYIPLEHIPQKSIITIAADLDKIKFFFDKYKGSKLRINLIDKAGKKYKSLPVTDLRFYEYAMQHEDTKAAVEDMNTLIHDCNKIFLRIGLGRPYKADDVREGYWLQVNAVYSFRQTA